MANQKCPNCNHFTYSQGLSSRAVGFFLIIGAFIAPIIGPLAFQSRGGYGDSTSNDTWTTIFFILFILGLVIFIWSFISPDKTVTFSCSNCKYEEKIKIK